MPKKPHEFGANVNLAPIHSNQKVLVMLSGGPDSTCLLSALVERLGAVRVGALHVNYGLRGEADADEAFCRELCTALGVRFWAERATIGPGNLQAGARALRYELADELAAREGFDLIATGHTASDQAETLLYRLVSSPGRRALLGIAERDGKLIRPLLGVTREEVGQYCESRSLSYREDASNADLSFGRNRIRAKVIPELEAVHPAAVANILATREQLADEAELLDAAVEQAMNEIGADGEINAVAVGRLGSLPIALRRLILRELAERAAGRSVAMSVESVDRLLTLAAGGGTRELDLGSVKAISEYGVIRFTRQSEPEPPLEPAELGAPGACTFGEWEVSCELLTDWSPLHDSSEAEATLDAELAGTRLTVRSWRDGDRIVPLGMDGSKSLQDLLTDHRIPRALRRRLPVVETAGEIAWVAGVAVSENFKVSNTTERVLRLRAVTRPSPGSKVPPQVN